MEQPASQMVMSMYVSVLNFIQELTVKYVIHFKLTKKILIQKKALICMNWKDTNGCAARPCQNGATCIPGNGNSYTCTCSQGYSGTNCQTCKNLTNN